MTVYVEKPPRAPRLTGDYSADYVAIYDAFKLALTCIDQLRERSGGETDAIAANAETAASASATANASQAGATIPTEGGATTLDPANPLTYTLLTQTTARLSVLGHTRTGAASPLVAASVTAAVARGVRYYVYYSDAGDVGGVKTFLASSDLATVTGTAGYRIIGTITVPAYNYSGRYAGSGVEP